jgi:hypothetical protein
MADLTENIDGDLTLDETRDRCKVEQDGGFQLQNIQNGTINSGGVALPVNVADFAVMPIGGFTDLLFVAVGANNPNDIKSQNQGAGWTFICDSKIYVQGQITRVLVFGK